MPHADKLPPADPADIAGSLAFALRYEGRTRNHSADDIMADIVAKRLVDHLQRSGFVILKKPPAIGGASLALKQNGAASGDWRPRARLGGNAAARRAGDVGAPEQMRRLHAIVDVAH